MNKEDILFICFKALLISAFVAGFILLWNILYK